MREKTQLRLGKRQLMTRRSKKEEMATEMRKRAMESLGQTQKRKEADDGENEGRKWQKKKRSSGNDTVAYLSEKNERVRAMHQVD